MKFVVDENTTTLIVVELRRLSHTVYSIHEGPYKGFKNGLVYNLALKENAVLVTRDQHFLNPLRYPTHKLTGLIFIRAGNLAATEEKELVMNFVNSFPLEKLKGKKAILSRHTARVRD